MQVNVYTPLPHSDFGSTYDYIVREVGSAHGASEEVELPKLSLKVSGSSGLMGSADMHFSIPRLLNYFGTGSVLKTNWGER